VPILGELMNFRVTLCCGINDNPKLPKHHGGTFCGQLWDTFLPNECRSLGQGSCNKLCNAKLFLVIYKHSSKNGLGGIQGINIAMWLMGVWHKRVDYNQTMLKH
jgi:hypothetical protein